MHCKILKQDLKKFLKECSLKIFILFTFVHLFQQFLRKLPSWDVYAARTLPRYWECQSACTSKIWLGHKNFQSLCSFRTSNKCHNFMKFESKHITTFALWLYCCLWDKEASYLENSHLKEMSSNQSTFIRVTLANY